MGMLLRHHREDETPKAVEKQPTEVKEEVKAEAKKEKSVKKK